MGFDTLTKKEVYLVIFYSGVSRILRFYKEDAFSIYFQPLNGTRLIKENKISIRDIKKVWLDI